MKTPYNEIKEKYINFLESEIHHLYIQNQELKDQKPEKNYDINFMEMEISVPPSKMEIPLQATMGIKEVNDYRKAIVLRYGTFNYALYFDDRMADNFQVIESLCDRFFCGLMEEKVNKIKLGHLLREATQQ